MSTVEVFLDETPGETRGVVVRNGLAEHLIIQREDDAASLRLGARSVGRVARIEPALNGAFIDFGAGTPFGFLPTKGHALDEGGRVEVEVSAEPRDDKGPALKLIGPGAGELRLIAAGPDVRTLLADLAPGIKPIGGAEAIQAGWDAEEEALEQGSILEDVGLDLKLERTRAMIVADFDWAVASRMHGNQARARANARGLAEVARLMRLKSWGGLAAVDLIGTGFDGEAVTKAARQAFGNELGLVLGPVNRFGVLMLSKPWGRTPVEALLRGDQTRIQAQDVVRGLNHALLTNRAAATITARCAPDVAEAIAARVSRLGPRAHLTTDPTLAQGQYVLEEG